MRTRRQVSPVILAVGLAASFAASCSNEAPGDGLPTPSASQPADMQPAPMNSEVGGQPAVVDPNVPMPTVSVPPTPPGTLPADWWDAAWKQRRKVVVKDALLEAPLTDFAVPVKLGAAVGGAFDYAQVKPDGSDLRFVSSDGVVLSHEIEAWDPAGESLIWLRLPTLAKDAASDVVATVWLYFANPAAPVPDAALASGTWAMGHTGVWHFAGSGNDATPLAHHAMNEGATFVDGKFGQGAQFSEKALQYLVVSPGKTKAIVSGAQGSTLSVWVNPTIPRVQATGSQGDNDDNGNVVFTIGGYNPDQHNSYTGFNISAEGRMITHVDPADTRPYRRIRSEPGVVTMNEWAWLNYVIDLPKGEVRFFKDGKLVAALSEGPFTDVVYNAKPSAHAVIGTEEDYTKHFYDGIMDELRIEAVIRPPEWIAAQFRAMTVAGYVTIGE